MLNQRPKSFVIKISKRYGYIERADIDIAATLNGKNVSGIAWMNYRNSGEQSCELHTQVDHIYDLHGKKVHRVLLTFSHLVSPSRCGNKITTSAEKYRMRTNGGFKGGMGKIVVTLTRAKFHPKNCLPKIFRRSSDSFE